MLAVNRRSSKFDAEVVFLLTIRWEGAERGEQQAAQQNLHVFTPNNHQTLTLNSAQPPSSSSHRSHTADTLGIILSSENCDKPQHVFFLLQMSCDRMCWGRRAGIHKIRSWCALRWHGSPVKFNWHKLVSKGHFFFVVSFIFMTTRSHQSPNIFLSWAEGLQASSCCTPFLLLHLYLFTFGGILLVCTIKCLSGFTTTITE